MALEKNQGRPPTPRVVWVHQILAAAGVGGSTTMVLVFVRWVVLFVWFWLMTRQSYLSYVRFWGVTKWSTYACTIPFVFDTSAFFWVYFGLGWLVQAGYCTITTLLEDRKAKTRKNSTHFSVWMACACVSKDTSWILAVWYHKAGLCRNHSIWIHLPQSNLMDDKPSFLLRQTNFTTFFFLPHEGGTSPYEKALNW